MLHRLPQMGGVQVVRTRKHSLRGVSRRISQRCCIFTSGAHISCIAIWAQFFAAARLLLGRKPKAKRTNSGANAYIQTDIESRNGISRMQVRQKYGGCLNYVLQTRFGQSRSAMKVLVKVQKSIVADGSRTTYANVTCGEFRACKSYPCAVTDRLRICNTANHERM